MSPAVGGHVAPRVWCKKNAAETSFPRRGLYPLHAGENVFSTYTREHPAGIGDGWSRVELT